MLEERQSACPIPLLEKLDETGIEEISSFGIFFLSFWATEEKDAIGGRLLRRFHPQKAHFCRRPNMIGNRRL